MNDGARVKTKARKLLGLNAKKRVAIEPKYVQGCTMTFTSAQLLTRVVVVVVVAVVVVIGCLASSEIEDKSVAAFVDVDSALYIVRTSL